MTVALVAPELIILWATRQWFAARGLARQHKEYGWTKTHGFFAQMGGFVYEENFCTRTIFPDELDPYLRDEAIDITEEEIQDRSKADMLAKCLVILQTSWFILQFFARISRRLPVTELELVTLAFAMLNFVTYFFWWNKPLNLTCPVRIIARSSQPTSQDSPASPYVSPTVENPNGVFGPGDLPTSSNGQSIARFESNNRLVFKTVPVMLSPDNQPIDSDGQHSLIEGFEDHFEGDLGCLTPSPPMNRLPVDYTDKSANTNRQSQTSDISSRSIFSYKIDNGSSFLHNIRTRWGISGVVMRFYLIMRIPIQEFMNLAVLSGGVFTWRPKNGVPPYYYGHLESYEGLMASLLATSTATVFGAIHCAAWFFQFPSRTEQILWRTSAVFMTCTPIVCFTALVTQSRCNKLVQTILLRTITPISFLYFFARLILLVQMFLLLRSLPLQIYTTIHWIDLIPHI